VFVYSKRVNVPRNVNISFYVLLFFSLLFGSELSPTPDQFESEANFNLAINKSSFFYEKSWNYFTASEINSPAAYSNQYPMFRTIAYHDVLGKFFTRSSENPNLVFIIVEGLGRDFVGDGAMYGGFTPFIDSLTKRSLYWENFLSTAGRTFNVLPSVFGSLPYSAHGFMELGGQMPTHLTLISLLKQQGYFTSFFYGGNANFDLQDVFLDRQGIDYILDQNKFGPSYQHAASDEHGFTWGYDDGDVFKRSLEIRDTQKKSPRLDIYLTLSTHEPFIPPCKEMYWKRFDERLAVLPLSEDRKKLYREYREVFATLLYFDDALREFIMDYEQRSDFNRTIFFITGDHRLIPLPIGEQIDRFHVPFIIYSPMLREPRKFSSISTHSDVTPTVLAFLHGNYDIDIPAKASWLSSGIDTARGFRNIHSMPIMRNKSELIDYIDGTSYIAGEQTFKLKPGMAAEQVENDSLSSALHGKLELFKRLNNYVCAYNRLYPDTLPNGQHASNYLQDDSAFASLKIDSLNSDELFERARTAAFNNRHDEARVICRRLLRINPRNTDVRMLLGRTFAWDKDYVIARSMYFEVLRQMPSNVDALSALADIELWSGNNERALALTDSSLIDHPESEALLVRKARALTNLGRTNEAKSSLRKAQKLNPKNEEATTLKRRLGL
jgi:Flp pilus assembly protein TadD